MSFRKELKSILMKSKSNLLEKWISENNGKILYPERNINSVYFDNDNLSMYHDSIEGSVPRKKIRIRNYNKLPEFHLGNNKLELKISSVEGRFKKVNNLHSLNLANYKIQDENYGSCYPVICISYKRIYYQLKEFRLTVDKNINYRKIFFGRISNFYFTEPNNIIEIKYLNQKDDKIFNIFPFHLVRFSKYCRAIESIY
jgi:hypothetical protein